MSHPIKNIEHSTVLPLAEQVTYQPGQIVSKTLAQNKHHNVTLFAFDKNEEISAHDSSGDELAVSLLGIRSISFMLGIVSLCPPKFPTPFTHLSALKCC